MSPLHQVGEINISSESSILAGKSLINVTPHGNKLTWQLNEKSRVLLLFLHVLKKELAKAQLTFLNLHNENKNSFFVFCGNVHILLWEYLLWMT